MHKLVMEAKPHFDKYRSSGAKKYRSKQIGRITIFLLWVAAQYNVNNLHGIGSKHVIAFWGENREGEQETLYAYWKGIHKLWEWLGRADKPPRPLSEEEVIELAKVKRQATECLPAPCEAKPIAYAEFAPCVRDVMATAGISTGKLANMTGIFGAELEGIISGETRPKHEELSAVMKALGIGYAPMEPA